MQSKENEFPAARLPSSEALSYLGDAVYSLYVREFLVSAGISHAGELNRLAQLFVTAPRQAALVKLIEANFTDWESDIYRRAYNHKGLKAPKHASYADYRAATGLEAVLGALYHIGKSERIHALLDEAHKEHIAIKDHEGTLSPKGNKNDSEN